MRARQKWRAQTQTRIGHLRSRLNQTLPDSVPYQAGGLMRVKFLHDSGPMRGEVAPMKPYYILMKLPGSDQLEYLLMTPFTPQKRDNMISWMAARSDFPDYGTMLFYQLLKEKLIYGPMQIEAMINQNTTIAQQLTLWDQKGSKVIRGNLIAVPIENSFLYVVPLYLTAEGTDFPQLKRVIGISGDKVAMEPTLDEAIQSVFGTQQPRILRRHPAGNRNSARRGRSSMRLRKQCSRGIGQHSARQWQRSSACWPGRHNSGFNSEKSYRKRSKVALGKSDSW
jgi:uncharacterized membrane protein (UPF0182 family)